MKSNFDAASLTSHLVIFHHFFTQMVLFSNKQLRKWRQTGLLRLSAGTARWIGSPQNVWT